MLETYPSETEPLALPFDRLELGMRFEGRGKTISEADIVQFAGTTGDMHPQHIDMQWAESSRFGTRIAHGLLVLSTAVGMLPLEPRHVVALRRIDKAVFKRPVQIGDTVRAIGRITGLTPLDDRSGMVSAAITAVNQRQRTVVRAQLELVWARTTLSTNGTDEPGMALL